MRLPFFHHTSADHNFHPSYRPDIDGLRAVAILSVVCFHAFPGALQGGFVGVDVFFVISGYLISSIIFKSQQRQDFSFAEFYAHRVKRIFPALVLVLTTSFFVGWFALLPDEFKLLGKHIAAGAGFVQNIVLWQEAGYFDTASELKPLLHLWSLAIEEQFYLIYPLMIWAVWRARLNVLWFVVLLGLLSFGLNVYGVGADAVQAFFSPQTRFWELLAGALLAYLKMFRPAELGQWLDRCVSYPARLLRPSTAAIGPATRDHILSVVGLLLVVAADVGLSRSSSFPGWWALAPVLGACLLILAGPQAWVNRTILANRLMVFVGLISYPLYLWHWPLLSFARIMDTEAPTAQVRIAAVLLSFLLAWLTYRLLERPIRFGRRTWIKTAVLCLLTGLVGFIGYNDYDRDGLAFRNKLLALANAQLSWSDANNSNPICRRAYPRLSQTYCSLAKEGPPTVLLLGDSHSNHLYPGLAEAARATKDNVMNLADGGCVPFFDVASHRVGDPDICRQSTNTALQFALDTKSVRMVIMSFRGVLYYSGKGFGAGPSESITQDVALAGRPDITDYRQIFEVAMRATLQRLVAAKKEVVFVLDTPELDFDPKWCVGTMPLTLAAGPRKTCGVPRARYDERVEAYRQTVLAVLKDFPSVRLFDAAAHLCDAEYCWAAKDGTLFFRDSNHLSMAGSELLGEALVREAWHPAGRVAAR